MKLDKREILSRLTFSDYQRLILSLKQGAGNASQGLCPFHDDHNPSLTVDLSTGHFKCFGCGKTGDVFDLYQKVNGEDFKAALEALAGWTGVTQERKPTQVIKATYDYKDEAGNLIFQVVRFEPGPNGKPKDFRQRQPDSKGGWTWNVEGVRLVLYNLPALLQAQEVFVVEGEKDADSLNSLGLVATTNAQGAGKWQAGYTDSLTGKDVIILPDNDEIGKAHAQKIAQDLQGKVNSLKVIELQGLPEKGDVSDWLQAGHTQNELLQMVQEAPEWEPITEKPHIPLISSVDLMRHEAKPIEWLVDGLIPAGSVTLLAAPPSCYKTWLALYLGCCVAEGKDCIGRQTIKTPVYYIDRENPAIVIQDRLGKIGVSENFHFWPLWEEPEPPALDNLEKGLSKFVDIEKDKPLIILDSLIRFHSANENDATEMAPVMGNVRHLSKGGATIFLIHHAGKGEDSEYRGSSEIKGGVDIAYTLKKAGERLTLKGTKNRLVIEPIIPINIVVDGDTITFQDVSGIDQEVKAHEQEMGLETIREIIEGFDEPPTQTEVISQAKESSDMGRTKVIGLLNEGLGKKWKVQKGGQHNSARYVLLEANSHLFTCSPPYIEKTSKQLKNTPEGEFIDITPRMEKGLDNNLLL